MQQQATKTSAPSLSPDERMQKLCCCSNFLSRQRDNFQTIKCTPHHVHDICALMPIFLLENVLGEGQFRELPAVISFYRRVGKAGTAAAARHKLPPHPPPKVFLVHAAHSALVIQGAELYIIVGKASLLGVALILMLVMVPGERHHTYS